MNKNEELKNRLKSRIKIKKNGCWIYTRSKNKKGYGRLSAWGKLSLAHRISYIVFKGEIPNGKYLDHLCRNRSCINPNHLEPVTNRENILRGIGIAAINYRKKKCTFGHKFDKKNTLVRPDGRRQCINCKKRQMEEYNQKIRNIKSHEK